MRERSGRRNHGNDRTNLTGTSRYKRSVMTPDGETVYTEEKQVTVDPFAPHQEEIVTEVSPRCESCGQLLTREMFSFDVKPCFVCKKKTCSRCRPNTNVTEFLKPEVRGQPICFDCWNSAFIMKQLQITCPSCGHPVRNYDDIKTCMGWCREKRCQSCGIPTDQGGLVCGKCHPKYAALAQELASWQGTWT